MIISIGIENQVTYSTYFHVKSLGIDGMQLNIIKVIGDKLTANIILKGKKLKVFFFPLK